MDERTHAGRIRAESDVRAAGGVAGRVVDAGVGAVEQVDAGHEEAEARAGAVGDGAPVPPDAGVAGAVERDHHELGRAVVARRRFPVGHRSGRRRLGMRRRHVLGRPAAVAAGSGGDGEKQDGGAEAHPTDPRCRTSHRPGEDVTAG